jgi:hypothetical protein
MASLLIKGRNVDTDRHAHRESAMGRKMKEHQRCQRSTRSQERARDRFSLSPQKEPTCQRLDLGLLAPRTMRQYISVVSPKVVVLCYSSHSITNTLQGSPLIWTGRLGKAFWRK